MYDHVYLGTYFESILNLVVIDVTFPYYMLYGRGMKRLSQGELCSWWPCKPSWGSCGDQYSLVVKWLFLRLCGLPWPPTADTCAPGRYFLQYKLWWSWWEYFQSCTCKLSLKFWLTFKYSWFFLQAIKLSWMSKLPQRLFFPQAPRLHYCWLGACCGILFFSFLRTGLLQELWAARHIVTTCLISAQLLFKLFCLSLKCYLVSVILDTCGFSVPLFS